MNLATDLDLAGQSLVSADQLLDRMWGIVFLTVAATRSTATCRFCGGRWRGTEVMLVRTADKTRFGRIYQALQRAINNTEPIAFRHNRYGSAFPTMRFVETLKAILPLIGVMIGAVATYLVSGATQRARWRQSQDVRWDDRRLTAYIAFGEASKRIFSIAFRIASHRGFHDRGDPQTPEEGLPLLSAAVADRAVSWEALLLLGGSGALEAAREWHRVLRAPVAYARGEATDPDDWQVAEHEVDLARDRFYIAARDDLGVSNFRVSAHLPPR